MSFYHIRSRECAKYDAVIQCSVLVQLVYNRANTRVDAKGATMAKLDKLANENRIENRNRNHNNILFGSRPRIQCFAIYYERTLCSLLSSIHTDGIRMFLNTLTEEVEANCKITYFCSGIINLLFVDK